MKRIIYCSIAREQSKNGHAAVLCKQGVEAGFCTLLSFPFGTRKTPESI